MNSYIELIEELIEDYLNDQNNYLSFFNLSTNCDTNTYEIKYNSTYNDLLTYFNTYIFYAQNDINSTNSIQTIQANSPIYSMILLNEHRLALGCEDKKIKIFNMIDSTWNCHFKLIKKLYPLYVSFQMEI